MKAYLQKNHQPVNTALPVKGLLELAPINEPPVSNVLPIAYAGLRSAGEPLEPKTRALFEPRFHHDFSNVRIHKDMQAAESARAVNAQAFTYGNHIVFDQNKYAPECIDGKRLIDHELFHVVQQAEGVKRIQRLQNGTDMSASTRTASNSGKDVEREWSVANPEGRVTEYGRDHLLLWNFDVGKAVLKPEHLSKLEELVSLFGIAYALNPQAYFSIRGRASKTGNCLLNQQLSGMRVDAVWSYLKSRGVDKSRIELDWYGDTQPIASERLFFGKGMAENRSVEVKLIGLGQEPKKQDQPPVTEPKKPIAERVGGALKFARAGEPKGLKEKICKDLPKEACYWGERLEKMKPPGLLSVLTLKYNRLVITEVSKAQTENERNAWAFAFAYTFVSYAVTKKKAELPPNYFSLEPNARQIWGEVSFKVWLSLDIDAINNPEWEDVASYIRANPEAALDEVYKKVAESIGLKTLRDFKPEWPMPTK